MILIASFNVTCFSIPTFEVSLISEFSLKFVSTDDGQTRVIYKSGSSIQSDSMNPFTANFEAQQTDLKGKPIRPESDDITTSYDFSLRYGSADFTM